MQEFQTFTVVVVRSHKLREVKNECTVHDFIVLAIFEPKIIKFRQHLTKLREKQFWLFFFWDRMYVMISDSKSDPHIWKFHKPSRTL